MKKLVIILILLLGIGSCIFTYKYYNNSILSNNSNLDESLDNSSNNQLHSKVDQNKHLQDNDSSNNDQLHNKVDQNNTTNSDNNSKTNNEVNNKTTTAKHLENNTSDSNKNCPYSLQDFYGKWTAIKAVGSEEFSLGYTLSDIDKTMVIKEDSLEVNGQTFNCKEILEPFNLRKFEDLTHSTPKGWGLPKIDYILNNKYQNTLYIVDSNHLITNIGGVIFEFVKQ